MNSRWLRIVALVLCALPPLATAQVATVPSPVPDASHVKPSQADMVLGTRVTKDLKWAPPTDRERLQVYLRGIYGGPSAYIRSFTSAALDQGSNTPPDWGQGTEGYAKRLANRFAIYTLQDTFSAGLAYASKYEVRYVQCQCSKVLPRIGHAIAWNFVTYNGEGKTRLNWPSLAGNYAGGFLGAAWTPSQKWSAQGLQAGNSQLYFGIISTLLQEFAPNNIIPKKFRKHGSKGLLEEADKVTTASHTP